MKQPLCKAPFIALRYSANGTMNPCCWMSGFTHIESNQTTPEMYWKDDKLKKVREELLNHKLPKTCSACAKSKDTLNSSRINLYNKIYNEVDAIDRVENFEINQPFKLFQMDINFSNVCNLKCRHCGTHNSSSWAKDDQDLQKIAPALRRQTEQLKNVNFNNTDFIHKKHIFENVIRIDFKGGEPMMQDEMYILLKNLIKWGFAKNIFLSYVTNGTKNADKVKDLWPEFKRVKCNFSIEATGKLFQYIRGGKHFTIDDYYKNFIHYSEIESCTLNFATSIMVYNMFDLPNVLNFIKQLEHIVDIDPQIHDFDNVVQKPEYLFYPILPKGLKEEIINHYEKTNYIALTPIKKFLIENIDYEDKPAWHNFKIYTKELDKLRNENFTSIVPQFQNYM